MSDQDAIVRQIIHVVPLLMRNVGADLRCHGVGLAPAHFRLLGILYHQTLNLSELAENQAVTLATMSNSIATMVERGWVERMPAPHDRRVVQVGITASGKQMLHDVHNQLEQRVVGMLKSLPEEELADLEKGMRVLTKMLEQADWKSPIVPCDDPEQRIDPGINHLPAIQE